MYKTASPTSVVLFPLLETPRSSDDFSIGYDCSFNHPIRLTVVTNLLGLYIQVIDIYIYIRYIMKFPPKFLRYADSSKEKSPISSLNDPKHLLQSYSINTNYKT